MTAALDRVRQSLSGRYEITGELGRGGMAIVYVARDTRHGREVAVKVFSPAAGASLDPARFTREIRITAGLAHPGIVPVFDSGEADALLFYVMPLIRGESLRARMSRIPALTPQEGCGLLAEVADALDAAHRAGVVHRDVKPENILLADGRPLVTDFGIAWVTLDQGESLTRTGTLIGTALYMSPEQLDGGGSIDGRADVFAVGCILFEMLSGAPPFAAPTFPAILARLATERAPELPARVSANPALRGVLGKALARSPADRYATAHELAAALRGIEHNPGQRRSMVRPVSRRVLWLAMIGVALLALGVAVASRRSGAAAVPSVAVLPFVNVSDDTSLEYISDGVTEELQTALGNAGIAVASRDASFAWKGRTPTSRQVTDSLHVDNLLEGSVRQTADSLRITVRLIDGKTMLQRKTFSLTRKREDVFALQEEVAQAMAVALRPSIVGGAADTLVRNRTRSLAAYDLVLRAAHLQSGGAGAGAAIGQSRVGARIALALADSAIALDSNYAPAWARRALVLQNQSVFGDEADTTRLRLARDAAARAVALDDRNPDSQVSYGLLLFRYEWRWADAEQHLRRAIVLNPRLASVHSSYSRFLRSMGRFDEARAELTAAHTIAPDPGADQLANARISYFERDYARAIQETPSEANAQLRTYTTWTAQAYIGAGQYKLAEALLARAEHGGDPGGAPLVRATLYALTHRVDRARKLLDSIGSGVGSNASLQAGAYAALGDTARALDFLDRGMREHDASIVDLKVSPILDPLRKLPRFQAIMRRLDFP